MSEQTVVVESSPTIEVDRGPLVTLSSDQRAEFRRTGELPEPPKKEESAPSDAGKAQTSEPEGKPAGETEPPKKPQEQNRRKPGAEQRIAELTSETKRLKAELETLKTKPVPQAQPQPKPVEQPQQFTRSKPTADDKSQDGKPKYTTYEEFVEDLADWKAEQRMVQTQRQQAQQTQARELDTKVQDARTRYGDKFDEVLQPTVNAIVSDQSVSPIVKSMLNDSEVLPDLIFTLGSDQKELAHFVEMAKKNPGKAIRYISLTESLIREELEAKSEPKQAAPAKPQTSAPKPPSEVGGRAATPGDELTSAAKSNDFRRFKALADRQSLARLKG